MREVTRRSPKLSLLTLWGIWLLCLPFHLVDAICYYPDGESIAPQDVPCLPGSSDSACCGVGYACVSNGLCMRNNKTFDVNSADEFVRGSCTDQKWRAAACPAFCIGPKDNTAGGHGVDKCDGSGVDSYCCINGGECDCETGYSTLQFQGTPSILTTIGVTETTAPSSSETSQSTTKRVTTTSSDFSTSPYLFTSSSLSPVAISGSFPTGTDTPLPSSSASESAALKAGLGVGIPLGVIALGLAGYLMWQRRHRFAKHQDPSLGNDAPAVHDKAYDEPQPPAYPTQPQELAWDNEARELPTHPSPMPHS